MGAKRPPSFQIGIASSFGAVAYGLAGAAAPCDHCERALKLPAKKVRNGVSLAAVEFGAAALEDGRWRSKPVTKF